MSLLEHEHTSNDAELISKVRGGDLDAYGELFARHKQAADRLAHTLTAGAEADDLVSDAFNKVLNVLLKGGGPDLAFRAYLLTSVRRVHIDKIRHNQRATPTDDLEAYDKGIHPDDPAVADFEGGAAAKAFASLPERWQMVLWHLEVENQKPAEIAQLLGMSAHSVSALAYRAREGLRQAFLNEHAQDTADAACRETQPLLGAYVRKALSKRDTVKVEAHLDNCRKCTAAYLELAEVNTSIGAVIAPALLGGAAIAYLATGTSKSVVGIGIGAMIGRARDFVVGNTTASVAAAAAGVIVVGGAVTGTIATINKSDNPHPAKHGSASGKVTDQRTPSARAKPKIVPPSAQPTVAITPESDQTKPTQVEPTQVQPTPTVTPQPTHHLVPSRPTAEPTKHPSPTKKATPDTSPGPAEPPPSPTASRPAQPVANAGVQVDSLQIVLVAGYRVSVTGVPAGAQAKVDITVTGATLTPYDLIPFTSGPCTAAGSNFVCTAGPGNSVFYFTRIGLANGSLKATVTPIGYTDPNPGDDSDSIPIY